MENAKIQKREPKEWLSTVTEAYLALQRVGNKPPYGITLCDSKFSHTPRIQIYDGLYILAQSAGLNLSDIAVNRAEYDDFDTYFFIFNGCIIFQLVAKGAPLV